MHESYFMMQTLTTHFTNNFDEHMKYNPSWPASAQPLAIGRKPLCSATCTTCQQPPTLRNYPAPILCLEALRNYPAPFLCLELRISL